MGSGESDFRNKEHYSNVIISSSSSSIAYSHTHTSASNVMCVLKHAFFRSEWAAGVWCSSGSQSQHSKTSHVCGPVKHTNTNGYIHVRGRQMYGKCVSLYRKWNRWRQISIQMHIHFHQNYLSKKIRVLCFFQGDFSIWLSETRVSALWVVSRAECCFCPAHWAAVTEGQGAAGQTENRGHHHWYHLIPCLSPWNMANVNRRVSLALRCPRDWWTALSPC